MSTATAIKCGNCKHYHESVAAVKACYGQTPTQAANQASDARLYDSRPSATNAPAMTEKQRNFLTKLFTERGRDAVWIENRIKGLSMGQASIVIEATLKTPKATQTIASPALKAPKVPSGRYAVVIDGVTKFFKVDSPTEGPWAGRTFVKIQASDELHRIAGETARAVLVLIAKDPEAASKLYGRELGHCGVCGRTLTDETSRANGIGPICAEKQGW